MPEAILTFVTFKWRPYTGYRSKFDGETVNTLYRMVKRNYHKPFRFVVCTDDAEGITEPGVEIYRLWDDFAAVPSPHGRGNPSCYRRLRLFAPKPGKFLGERFVSLDLDTVIVGDITPLFDREEDFIIWRSCTNGNPYNGSMFYMKAGARPQVWSDFTIDSPKLTKKAGIFGSDQAWIAYRLGGGEAVWDQSDGVYSYRLNVRAKPDLPDNARIVFFHGNHDPWDDDIKRRHPWVAANYR